MISPFVTLKSSSWVMEWRPPQAGVPAPSPDVSSRPLHLAAGLALRQRCLVAGDHMIDAEKIVGVARRLRHRLADEGRGHELMVAGAVIAFIGLKLDVIRQLEPAKRLGELPRVKGLF